MPITRQQFELGIDSEIEEWMRKIYDFLELHKNQAFTESEIGEALGGIEAYRVLDFAKGDVQDLPPSISGRARKALERLVSLGAANERDVAGQTYYATGQLTLSEILPG